MKRIVVLVAAFALIAPAAQSQNTGPESKRAVLRTGDFGPVQAKALTTRISTSLITKEFFVAYGGEVWVSYKIRSDGTNVANSEVRFGNNLPSCGGTTTSATFFEFGCGSRIAAGEFVTINVFGSGQAVALCCAKMQFHLVNVREPALATKD